MKELSSRYERKTGKQKNPYDKVHEFPRRIAPVVLD
jgi:hypothetical protein